MDSNKETMDTNNMDSPVINQIINKDTSISDRPPMYYRQMENLRSVEEIWPKFRDIFEFPYFNLIQSHTMNDVLYSDSSVVISAPTGSGKTVIFELAIIRLLMKMEDNTCPTDCKIIYVAPIKALCTERMLDWHKKFSNLGLTCAVLTSDTENFEFNFLKNFNLILTTPEKWDSITRKWKDNTKLVESVKLFMIDEVHLLNEETRGSVLEVIVSRMKTIQETMNLDRIRNNVEPIQIRFIAVSATIPNIEDISQWLGGKNSSAVYFKMGDDFRPVKLKKVVIGYPCAQNVTPFRFDMSLTYKLKSVILEYSNGKPILIFCSTRKAVEMTSSFISENMTFHLSPDQKNVLIEASTKMDDNKLKGMIKSGIGSHHAGMSLESRYTIENLFRNGNLPILVTTSTLSMGVNLPANLVIIKSTQQYIAGEYREYNEGSILQMIGRAGRPQFDTTATAVIMTKSVTKSKYERILDGNELIESNLHNHLKEHLNSEIALYTIKDFKEALNWLQTTFLYIRAMKNPKHYRIPQNYTEAKIEQKFLEMCQTEMNDLANHGLIEHSDDWLEVKPTIIGTLMARYYLNFESIKVFLEIKGDEKLSDMLMIISRCSEFADSFLRVNEKSSLNTLNRCRGCETIRFPLQGKIKSVPMKINCIIQAVFGNLKILHPSLSQESVRVMNVGVRLSKFLVEFLEKKENVFNALVNAVILSKCFQAKLWENSNHVCMQLHGIGPVLSNLLVSNGKSSFKSIVESDPRVLEMILNRRAPFGSELVEAAEYLPSYSIKITLIERSEFSKIEVRVILNNADKIKERCTIPSKHFMYLIVGDTQNNTLLYHKLYHNKMATSEMVNFYLEFRSNFDGNIKAHLISDNWVGFDCEDILYVYKHKETTPDNRKLEINNQTTSRDASRKVKGKSRKMSIQEDNEDIRKYLKPIKPNKNVIEDDFNNFDFTELDEMLKNKTTDQQDIPNQAFPVKCDQNDWLFESRSNYVENIICTPAMVDTPEDTNNNSYNEADEKVGTYSPLSSRHLEIPKQPDYNLSVCDNIENVFCTPQVIRKREEDQQETFLVEGNAEINKVNWKYQQSFCDSNYQNKQEDTNIEVDDNLEVQSGTPDCNLNKTDNYINVFCTPQINKTKEEIIDNVETTIRELQKDSNNFKGEELGCTTQNEFINNSLQYTKSESKHYEYMKFVGDKNEVDFQTNLESTPIGMNQRYEYSNVNRTKVENFQTDFKSTYIDTAQLADSSIPNSISKHQIEVNEDEEKAKTPELNSRSGKNMYYTPQVESNRLDQKNNSFSFETKNLIDDITFLKKQSQLRKRILSPTLKKTEQIDLLVKMKRFDDKTDNWDENISDSSFNEEESVLDELSNKSILLQNLNLDNENQKVIVNSEPDEKSKLNKDSCIDTVRECNLRDEFSSPFSLEYSNGEFGSGGKSQTHLERDSRLRSDEELQKISDVVTIRSDEVTLRSDKGTTHSGKEITILSDNKLDQSSDEELVIDPDENVILSSYEKNEFLPDEGRKLRLNEYSRLGEDSKFILEEYSKFSRDNSQLNSISDVNPSKKWVENCIVVSKLPSYRMKQGYLKNVERNKNNFSKDHDPVGTETSFSQIDGVSYKIEKTSYKNEKPIWNIENSYQEIVKSDYSKENSFNTIKQPSHEQDIPNSPCVTEKSYNMEKRSYETENFRSKHENSLCKTKYSSPQSQNQFHQTQNLSNKFQNSFQEIENLAHDSQKPLSKTQNPFYKTDIAYKKKIYDNMSSNKSCHPLHNNKFNKSITSANNTDYSAINQAKRFIPPNTIYHSSSNPNIPTHKEDEYKKYMMDLSEEEFSNYLKQKVSKKYKKQTESAYYSNSGHRFSNSHEITSTNSEVVPEYVNKRFQHYPVDLDIEDESKYSNHTISSNDSYQNNLLDFPQNSVETSEASMLHPKLTQRKINDHLDLSSSSFLSNDFHRSQIEDSCSGRKEKFFETPKTVFPNVGQKSWLSQPNESYMKSTQNYNDFKPFGYEECQLQLKPNLIQNFEKIKQGSMLKYEDPDPNFRSLLSYEKYRSQSMLDYNNHKQKSMLNYKNHNPQSSQRGDNYRLQSMPNYESYKSQSISDYENYDLKSMPNYVSCKTQSPYYEDYKPQFRSMQSYRGKSQLVQNNEEENTELVPNYEKYKMESTQMYQKCKPPDCEPNYEQYRSNQMSNYEVRMQKMKNDGLSENTNYFKNESLSMSPNRMSWGDYFKQKCLQERNQVSYPNTEYKRRLKKLKYEVPTRPIENIMNQKQDNDSVRNRSEPKHLNERNLNNRHTNFGSLEDSRCFGMVDKENFMDFNEINDGIRYASSGEGMKCKFSSPIGYGFNRLNEESRNDEYDQNYSARGVFNKYLERLREPRSNSGEGVNEMNRFRSNFELPPKNNRYTTQNGKANYKLQHFQDVQPNSLNLSLVNNDDSICSDKMDFTLDVTDNVSDSSSDEGYQKIIEDQQVVFIEVYDKNERNRKDYNIYDRDAPTFSGRPNMGESRKLPSTSDVLKQYEFVKRKKMSYKRSLAKSQPK